MNPTSRYHYHRHRPTLHNSILFHISRSRPDWLKKSRAMINELLSSETTGGVDQLSWIISNLDRARFNRRNDDGPSSSPLFSFSRVKLERVFAGRWQSVGLHARKWRRFVNVGVRLSSPGSIFVFSWRCLTIFSTFKRDIIRNWSWWWNICVFYFVILSSCQKNHIKLSWNTFERPFVLSVKKRLWILYKSR